MNFFLFFSRLSLAAAVLAQLPSPDKPSLLQTLKSAWWLGHFKLNSRTVGQLSVCLLVCVIGNVL